MSSVRNEKRFAWGAGIRQRLRLAPLFLSLSIADRVGRALRTRTVRLALPEWRAGISIIIPERDSPQLLLKALASLYKALDAVDEPRQVVVVANGAAPEVYDEIVAKYPEVEWVHHRNPLGFSAAIHKGLRHARYDWTFLMNNDMTLDRSALRAVCALRSAEVFAIACQIHQQSASGRREETGFTDWYVNAAGVQVFHADPGGEDKVRRHLCASAGAGLFRTAPLREYARDSRCYDPFYWEDVEWGVRAQQDGLSVLFCPGSHAWHQHRATSSRFYPAPEIERIVERNRILFDARNAITDHGAGWLMARVCDLSYDSQRGLARLPLAANVLRHRWRARRARRPASPPPLSNPYRSVTELVPSYSYRLGGDVRTAAEATARSVPRSRPRVLLVTPFCVFPPRHGGARRIDGLLRELRRDFDIVLVTDEAALYDARSFAYFDGLHAVHFVQRPMETNRGGAADLGQRLRAHCHPSLVDAVQAALRRYRPDLVQIEYVELASLSRLRLPSQRWILGLHDAFAATDFNDRAEGDRLEQSVVQSYDAVTVCSAEDQAMISHPRVVTVRNGSAAASTAYTPSMSFQLLFLGPFRYVQNLQGIRQFLSQAYPAIKAAEPAARLLILGGEQAPARIAGDAVFAQSGVTVLEHREDVAALLSASVLTLNPLTGIRGSSIKVIESLAAGRACVSTEDGARGFIDAGFEGLLTTSNVSDMAGVVIELLRDPKRRHRIEVPEAARLADYQWSRSAERQSALYRTLLELDGK
ncbi:MAG TPA: glycosyltransferase [Casimicrobiaceae bacterium]|jgi:GT2 family glycosyltransferase/glycosyltransferase involved in cell wall biosynthesis|nr:glycosyltransferase [Casimicrobiaceae bacterium]